MFISYSIILTIIIYGVDSVRVRSLSDFADFSKGYIKVEDSKLTLEDFHPSLSVISPQGQHLSTLHHTPALIQQPRTLLTPRYDYSQFYPNHFSYGLFTKYNLVDALQSQVKEAERIRENQLLRQKFQENIIDLHHPTVISTTEQPITNVQETKETDLLDFYKNNYNAPKEDDEYASQYKFGYRISDPVIGSEFGQAESRDGHITRGQYHVLLPDGRLQNVRYWSDHTGYHADISYHDLHVPHRYGEYSG